MIRRAAALAFQLLVLAASAPAQTAASRPESLPESLPTSAWLDGALDQLLVKHDLPAVGGAVVTSDRLLVIGAVGVRERGTGVRVTVHDRWHLGSCTKSMTATVLARLVERGKLRFDTTIGDVFATWDAIRPEWKPVTIEQMLAHRSGMPADLMPGGLWGRLWERKGTATDQRRELALGVLAAAPATRPNSAYLYTNAGFAVAGLMAEQTTGRAWEDLMRVELFEPLGMTETGFGAPGTRGVIDQPRGHRIRGGAPVAPGPDADNPPAIGPAGTVHATLRDWAKYAALHLRGARGESDYLKPESFARLHERPKEGDYAFGWGHHERPWANGHVLAHAGSNLLWYCVIWLAPGRDLAILSVCNMGGDGAAAATDAAISILMEAAVRERAPTRK